MHRQMFRPGLKLQLGGCWLIISKSKFVRQTIQSNKHETLIEGGLMLARRLQIWPNIKSAWGTVSASCLLGICRSKDNHSHTCSLHRKHDKQSDVNNSMCACVQCATAAHAHQCIYWDFQTNTGQSNGCLHRWLFCVVLLWHRQSINRSYFYLSLECFFCM